MTLAFQIKFASLDDIPFIFKMAKDLAQMQDLLHRFCITEETLAQMISTDCPTKTIVATINNDIVGFAMYTLIKNNRLYHDGFAMYVDELYVLNDYRGQGIGTALFKYIGKQALALACNRMEWWVERNNNEAVQFYQQIGSRALDEFTTYRMLKPALLEFVK